MPEKIRKETPSEKLTFEEALQRLENAVQQLESGELGLSEALQVFAEGIQHLKLCYQQLDQAQVVVEKLLDVDQNNQPVTESIAIDDISLEEKQQSRSRRRSSQ